MKRRGFTLIEIMMAIAGGAVILAAIYGIFTRAVHLRDAAMARTREVRTRAHAAAVLRNDLRNGLISGLLVTSENALASSLTGSQSSPNGGFPGYLKLTTTTQADDADLPSADVQQVEYYVVTDPNAQDSKSGRLVRAVDRDLLATVQQAPAEEPLLSGVQSIEVTFFDGNTWQTSWTYSTTDTDLPQAVKVRVLTAPGTAPIEVMVPWGTAPFLPPPST
jgi:type II secretion system protein J